jgi:hypothetical protein
MSNAQLKKVDSAKGLIDFASPKASEAPALQEMNPMPYVGVE